MKKKKLRDALQRQQALVNAARSANRSLSDSEQAEFDALQTEIEKDRCMLQQSFRAQIRRA